MRIRTIKPEFWSSDDICSLQPEDRLLFLGLMSYVDDAGRGRDDIPLIIGQLFAKDMFANPRETVARVSRGLESVFQAGLIHRYTVSGKRFFVITGWHHQKIDRPGKSRLPSPEEADDPQNDADRRPSTPAFATPSRQSRETPSVGTEEPSNRATGEQGIKSCPNGQDESSAIDSADRDASPSAEIVDAEIVDDEPAAPDHTEGTMVPVAEPERADVERVCQAMVASVHRRTGRTPTITRRWRTQARLMLDRDGVTEADALAAIAWSENDDFWRANILGIPKLREKYPTLSLQAQRPNRRHRKTFRELADELGISDPQPPPVFDETAQLQEKVPF